MSVCSLSGDCDPVAILEDVAHGLSVVVRQVTAANGLTCAIAQLLPEPHVEHEPVDGLSKSVGV
jgi:hypothetical protein